MTREQIEEQVLRDYAEFAGKVAKVQHLVYYSNNNSYDFAGEAIVRVLPNQRPQEIIVWNDDYCDPVWVVEPVSIPGLSLTHSSYWVHGISYQLGHGKTGDKHPEIWNKEKNNV